MRQLGLSLVELMISLTIGLVLLLGITTLIVQQSQTRDEMEKSSRQIENGRYAMQTLHDDIEHAGFYGKYFNLPAPPGTLPDPCATAVATLDTSMPLHIQGYNSLPSVSASFSCALDGASSSNNTNNYLTSTDILVIRRADTLSFNNPALAASSVTYLQTGYEGANPAAVPTASHVLATGPDTSASIFTLIKKPPTNLTPADMRTFITRIYFISPCSVPAGGGTSCTGNSDDNGRPIPTLKRLDLSATGFIVTPLVEGIENMQLDYGIDTNLDGYPESYSTCSACTTADWSNVMAIRINLLARNTECTTGYTDTKTYDLGSGAASAPTPAVTCTNGDYKRHVFTELVRAINPSGRRAQQ